MTDMTPSTPIPITLSWHQATKLVTQAQAVEQYRTTDLAGRFETTGEDVTDGAEVIASVPFDDGSIWRVDSYLTAICVAQVHQAHGHTAEVLWDMDADDYEVDPWCVLTSAPADL